jgi:hypothetical protein
LSNNLFYHLKRPVKIHSKLWQIEYTAIIHPCNATPRTSVLKTKQENDLNLLRHRKLNLILDSHRLSIPLLITNRCKARSKHQRRSSKKIRIVRFLFRNKYEIFGSIEIKVYQQVLKWIETHFKSFYCNYDHDQETH